MAIETPSWFNNDTYLANKVMQLNSIKEDGRTDWTVAEVSAAMGNMTPYEHFLQYGNKENISPNPDFNVAEYLAVKADALNAMNNGAGYENQQWTEKSVLDFFTKAGLTVWDHYTLYGTEEGLNPSNAFDTSLYLEAKAAQLNTSKHEGKTDWTVADVVTSFEAAGMSALEHYFLYGKDEGLTIPSVPADEQVHTSFNPYAPDSSGTPGKEYDLTTGADNITGTANDDTFYAYQMPDVISDSRNTLQSGDRIDGGAGDDTLYADLGATTTPTNSHTVTPVIKNVEVLNFRAQTTDPGNDGNNNVVNSGVRIDAERIAAGDNGSIELWSQNSRADLTIEDVRIDSNKVTIGMQNTDAGDVDYFVYFDPQHLKSEASTTTGTLYLQLIDTVGALSPEKGGHNDALYDNPYTGFKFTLNGKEYTVDFKGYNHDTDADPSYAELAALIQKTINDDPVLSKLGLTVTEGASFPAVVGIGDYKGETVNGTQIVITSSQGALTGDSWIAANGLPPTNSTSATFTQASDTDCPLIQTNVDLDNVGRVQWEDASPNCLPNDIIYGSNAGDLMIGSMANRGGVERFDVKVDNGSWISSLFSTNETLRMITVAAEDMDGDGKSGGQLYIGDWIGNNDGDTDDVNTGPEYNSMWTWTDAARLLTASQGKVTTGFQGTHLDMSDPSGLNDVAVFDAKDYTGDINIGAQITEASYTKYLKDLDTTATTTAPLEGYDNAFTYNTGSGNDVINMTVNGGIAADKDFKMVINTGAGDDLVAFQYRNMTENQNLNQSKLQNVTINTGDGNDTVWFYANEGNTNGKNDGTLKINTGAGNDTIYAGQIDHSQVQSITSADDYNAVLVFNVGGANALDATRAVFVDGLLGAQPLDNNILGPQAGFSYGANVYTTDQDLMVTVQFKDLTVTAKVADLVATNGYISATTINNVIIKAIADDPVLSQLLVAKDGAGHSLIIESLINGEVSLDDLSINFNVVNAQGGTVGAFTQVNDAYDAQYAMIENFTPAGTYVPLTGHNTTDGHSIVNAGAGDDVIALGGGARDIVVLGENFGHDTLVGFETGVDQFNLYGMGVSGSQRVNDTNIPFSVSNGSISSTANSLSIVDNSTLSKAGDHSYDVSDFKKVYGTTAFDQGSRLVFMKNGSSTTGDHTYTVFKVESSASGTTGNNATVTKLGSINTADVSLDGLGTGDFVFVDPVSGNYNLVPNVFAGETFGPTEYATASSTMNGTSWSDTFNALSNTNASNITTFNGLGGNDIFNIVDAFSNNQTINGGADNDTFNIGGDISGTTLNGGTGNDTFNITDATAGGTLNGGEGTDSLTIKASKTADVTGLSVSSIESITVTQAHNVTIGTMLTDTENGINMTVTAANQLNIGDLTAHAATTINASNVATTVFINGEDSDASLTLTGGKGSAILTGGKANDTLTAGAGGGEFTGGAGDDTIDLTASAKVSDTVVFSAAADNGTDTIKGFVGGASNGDILDFFDGTTTLGKTNFGTVVDLTTSTGNATAYIDNEVIRVTNTGGTLAASDITDALNKANKLTVADDATVVALVASATGDHSFNVYEIADTTLGTGTTYEVTLMGTVTLANDGTFNGLVGDNIA